MVLAWNLSVEVAVSPNGRARALFLTLQIAAGIVIAYAVIANRQAIIKSASWLGGALAVIAFLVVLIWLGGEALGAASPYIGKFYPKVARFVGVMLILAIGLIGGICLLQLAHALGWRKGKEDSEGLVAAASFANVALVALVTWPILSFTIIGDWYDAIDQWSRVNGHADGGALAVAAVFWLWPVAPMWILSRRNARQAKPEATQRPSD